MSVTAISRVWERSQAKGSELLVLLAIADYAHDDGRDAWPTMAKLAEKSRMTERGVRDIIRRLEAAGELLVEKNTTGREVRDGFRPRQFMHVLCCAEPAKISGRKENSSGSQPEKIAGPPEESSASPEKTSGESASETGTGTYVEPERGRTPLKEDPSGIRHSLSRERDPRRLHPLDEPAKLSAQQLAWLDRLVALYPRHDEGLRQATAEWLALNPDEALAQRILDDVKRRIDLGWGDEPRFVPLLAKYLAARSWQERFVAPRKPVTRDAPRDAGGPRVADADQTDAYLANLRSARR